jgi:phosphoserine phosphatase
MMFRSATSLIARTTSYSTRAAWQPSAAAGTPSSLRAAVGGLSSAPSSMAFHASALFSSPVSGDEMLKAFGSSGSLVGTGIPFAMQALAEADCVCFDVDSTVVNEEGIDVLADYLGKGEQVAALTRQAMEGGMKFQDALASRLALLEPSKASIEACLRDRPLELTEGVADLIQQLQAANKDVFLVSGGFRIMIEPVAEILKIPLENIVANTILFDDQGVYTGFDANEPTSQDMGKPKALEMIQANKGYKKMVMVGDGATDAQAKPPAIAFIGFGGVAVRDAVKASACWFVTDFSDMTKIVQSYSS